MLNGPSELRLGLLAAWAALLLAGSGACWAAVLRRRRAGRPMAPALPRRPVPWGLVDLLLALLLFVAFQSLGAAAASLLAGSGPPAGTEISVYWGAAAGSLAAAGASALAVRLRTRCTLRDLGWDAGALARDARLGATAFLLAAPPVYGLQALLTQWYPSHHPLVKMLERGEPGALALAWFAAVAAAPPAEEFLFRVLLQGWLEKAGQTPGRVRRWILGDPPPAAPAAGSAEEPVEAALAPDWNPSDPGPAVSASAPVGEPPPPAPPAWPIVVSAALFAALHGAHGPDWIPLFFLALVLGWLYRQTHRAAPSVVAHLLLNACSLIGLMLMGGRPQ